MSILNLEQSNPAFTADEGMHFLAAYSSALRGRGALTMYMPPGLEQTKNAPLAILLHGVYGSEFAWPYMGGAHVAARRLIESGRIRPMALAMPSDGLWGQGSGYLNLPGKRCEEWIVDDVPAIAQARFGCFTKASPLFIGGLSMGGYGALRIGTKHADRFRGVSGHSSALTFDPRKWETPSPEDKALALDPNDMSILHWVKTNRDRLPPLHFDCGVDDGLLEDNRLFHTALDSIDVPHVYTEHPGAHTWEYWHEHLAETLEFFSEQL